MKSLTLMGLLLSFSLIITSCTSKKEETTTNASTENVGTDSTTTENVSNDSLTVVK
jgi:hypothetical protein